MLQLNGSVVPENGTSFAAPLTAALAALVRAQHPSWSATQVKHRITSTATDIDAPGYDLSAGYGLINPLRALGVTMPPERPKKPEPPHPPKPPVASRLRLTLSTPLYAARGTTVTATFTVTLDGRPAAGAAVRVCVTTTYQSCQVRVTSAAGTLTWQTRMATSLTAYQASVTFKGQSAGLVRRVHDGLTVDIDARGTTITLRSPDATGQVARLWRWDGSTWRDFKTRTLDDNRPVSWTNLPHDSSFRVDVAARGAVPARHISPIMTN